ncbi:FAD-dependent oxidoreductase, partial [Cribrihabitans sp. XS_ASV171]
MRPIRPKTGPGSTPRSKISTMREDSMSVFPTSAKTVIIGGGIVGCSTAYHLAKLG